MTTSIARQSVIIKCNMQSAYILGNYEFYYGAGYAGKAFGFEIPDDIMPVELADLLAEKLKNVTANGPQEAHLLSILKEYAPENRYERNKHDYTEHGDRYAHAQTETGDYPLSFK